jgi:hypothetical protein
MGYDESIAPCFDLREEPATLAAGSPDFGTLDAE